MPSSDVKVKSITTDPEHRGHPLRILLARAADKFGAGRAGRSSRMADATKTFALNFPLRRTQNERTPIGTQPVNRLVAARDPW